MRTRNHSTSDYHSSIPKQLQTGDFRFIRVKNRDKTPLDSDYFQTNNFPGNNVTITKHLERKGNYGLIPVSNSICVLDIDDIEKAEQLGILDLFIDQFRTLIIKTGSGGLHVYFYCEKLVEMMETPKRIQLFDLVDESRHLGEMYPGGCRAYVVGPGSTHPNGNTYQIIQNAPILEIPFELVLKDVFDKVKHSLFEEEKNDNPQYEKRIPEGKYINLLSDELGLRIHDIASPIGGISRGTEIQGTHPVHGSKTGRNFSICERQNLWHCFRCDSGGDPITFVAVAEGLIQCHEAGKVPITGEMFERVKEVLGTKYGYGSQISEIERRWHLVQSQKESESMEKIVSIRSPKEERREGGLKFESYLPANNLIERYVSFAKNMTDAYPEFHYAGIFSLLSIAADRKPVIKMAHGKIYPNIWSMCLGISTISRKSTALKISRDLGRYHATLSELPSSFTPEALIEVLTDHPRVWWIKDEVGTLLSSMQSKKYMAEMRDFFNEIYENENYRRKLRTSRSKERKEFNIVDPYTTFLFATTPDIFSEQTTTSDLTSGWLLRFLFFFPHYYKVSRPYQAANILIDEEENEISASLGEIFDFFRFSSNELEFVISKSGLEFFQAWQRDIENQFFQDGDYMKLAQYGRLFAYALKLSMIFQIGDPEFIEEMATTTESGIKPGQQTIIKDEYVIEACRQINDYFAPIGASIVDIVERQTEINVQERILSLLRRNGGQMKRVEVLRALHIKLKEFNEHTAALIESNEIRIIEYQRPKRKPETWIRMVQND